MNASKLILAIAFFAFSTMVFAQTTRPDQNEPTPNLSVKISLKVAIQNDGLVNAMYLQLDPRSILHCDRPIIIAKVRYNHVVYSIFGKKAEWKKFFYDPSGLDL